MPATLRHSRRVRPWRSRFQRALLRGGPLRIGLLLSALLDRRGNSAALMQAIGTCVSGRLALLRSKPANGCQEEQEMSNSTRRAFLRAVTPDRLALDGAPAATVTPALNR